jgi:subtilisin family serine protease
MRPAPTGLTILLAGLTVISLSAQNQPPQARRAATIRTEVVNGREAAAGEVLVKLRGADPAADLRAIGALADAGAIDAVGRAGVRRVRSRSMTAAALLARLAGHPAVEYVEPNYILHAFADTNDPLFPQLWGLKNVGQGVNGAPGGLAGADIHATRAWDYATGSTAHVVAVVDTGIDYTHPDLAGNMWSAPAAFTVTIGGVSITCPAGTHGINVITMTCNPMDDNNHGTHVSGTIGASGNNALGVVGVNWVTQLMAIKFLDANGSGTVDAAISGIDFAIQAREAFAAGAAADVRVLSASWAGTGFSQALLDEILAANDHDMLFVAAAGNNGISNDILPMYPASYTAPNIVAVAATTNTDALAFFSNYSATSVHLGAPGVDVLSTTIGGNYAFLSGTSMATPHVSGAAALLLSLCPMDTAGVKNVLVNTVEPVAALATTTVSGGRLDVYSAIRSCVAPPEPATSLVVAPGDTKLTLTWAGAAGATGFNIKRSLASGGPYAPIATNVKGRTYADTTVVNGTTYYYVVSGVNGFGEGANSNEAFATPNAPSDLVLASLTAPGAGGAGVPMAISSTTTNRGPGNAVASSTRFYLSSDAVLDTADRSLGAQAVPALPTGASFTASSSFTVPVDTPAGLFYLFGKADADDVVNETSDSNNSGLRQVFIGPDLVVTSLTAPSGAAAGADVLVTDTVNNRGGGTGGRSTTRFYLSADVLLGANDVLLAAGRPVSELAPGASESGSATVTLPMVPAGTYFIIAVADGDNAVAECIESNNSTLFRSIRIGGDLAVTALTVPAKAGAGDTIQVTDTTTNQAAGAMGASSVTRFYLSTKAMFDASATLLPGSHAVPDLAAGAASTATTTVTLPSTLAVATYYLYANADADNAVAEISETNNTTGRAILVGGDLAVSALTAPTGGASGGTIVVGDTTTNQGGGAVAGSITRFYLSKDSFLDAADTVLDGSRIVPALAAGVSSAGSTNVRIPDAVVSGAYFLIAKADADGTVPESSETNNTTARSISIGPDLVVSSLTTVSAAAAGSTITVTDVVTNLGGETAAPSVTRYYLSVNGVVNANARLLDGSRTIPALAAGAASSGSAQLTIPANMSSGALYLVAKADADGAVGEGVESNNTRERVILILPPR